MIRTGTPFRVSHNASTSPVGPAPTIKTGDKLLFTAILRNLHLKTFEVTAQHCLHLSPHTSKNSFMEIRFECQGSGNCCVSRGGYGFVYLTKKDRKALSKLLGLGLSEFTEQYCELSGGIWKLKDGPTDDCMFLQSKRCSVYSARPTQCRTWPFWPEVLKSRTWNKEVKGFCPGVGKGKVWSEKEIQAQLKDQIASENEYGT
jgi:Fe-S-cluster containining protein